VAEPQAGTTEAGFIGTIASLYRAGGLAGLCAAGAAAGSLARAAHCVQHTHS
jgi:hypothetical protein